MATQETIEAAESLLIKIDARFPVLNKETEEIIRGIQRRMREGLAPTDGQMKYLRALARAKEVEENGRPSTWRGRWFGSDW